MAILILITIRPLSTDGAIVIWVLSFCTKAISPDPPTHPIFNRKKWTVPNGKSIAWSRHTIEKDKWVYVEILGSGWDLKSEQDIAQSLNGTTGRHTESYWSNFL